MNTGKLHVTIITNGFQVDYSLNLVNNLSDKIDKIDFIGSSIYDIRLINSNVNFINLRGSHDDTTSHFNKLSRISSYYLKLFRYLLYSKSQIVHTQWIRFAILDGVFLTLLIKLLGKKAYYTIHDVLPHTKKTLFFRVLYKIIYKLQDEIIVHTNFIKERIVNEFSISSNKIHVVPHGVYQVVDNCDVSMEDARNYLGINQDSVVLLFYGYIAKYKGIDILLEALKMVQEEGGNITLIIAGKLRNDYSLEFEEVLSKYQSNSIIKLIKYVNNWETNIVFKAADVTVLPYLEASQSGVLFMSYAYGVPVIVPNFGGFPDDILVDKTGYLFERNNSKSLKHVILRFCKNVSKMTEKNRVYIKEFAESNYSWDNSCINLVRLYKKGLE